MKKNNNKSGFLIFMILLVIVVALAIFASVGQHSVLPTGSNSIAVIDIKGTISENDGATYDQKFILEHIAAAEENPKNKGILLDIDSPGGAVYQIDEVYLALQQYKKNTGRPIYAAMENYAASGGYYIACAADQVYANPYTITGSIGVIAGTHLDVSKLLDRYGIKLFEITSGPNKSMGNPYQEMTPEQRSIYQSICDEYFGHFVQVVMAGRNLDEATVRTIADGRIYTASQAEKLGLIDGIESLDDTIARMQKDTGVSTLDESEYEKPTSITDFLSSILPTQTTMTLPETDLMKSLSELHNMQFMMYYEGA